MSVRKTLLSHEVLEPLIFSIRGHRVMLDADLARLYGVTTKRFNEAFKRNRDRFPIDFAFQLTRAEFASMRSQIATSRQQPGDLLGDNMNRSQIATGSMQGTDREWKISNWSQTVTSSQKHRDPRFRAWVFTEHGALMAANVLRSGRAVQMSVFVIRAFVRLREQVAENAAILKRLAEIDKTLLRHDASLRDIYRKLLPLLQPPPAPPKRRIGFIRDGD